MTCLVEFVLGCANGRPLPGSVVRPLGHKLPKLFDKTLALLEIMPPDERDAFELRLRSLQLISLVLSAIELDDRKRL